jgi:RNA polymerase sigma-70 factor (ECF subfamily)
VNTDPGSGAAAAVRAAYETEWTAVLATVMRVARDFDVAEDCVQDAFAHAVLTWGRDGVPRRPGAWLTTVAVRRALLLHRRSATAARWLPRLASADDEPSDPSRGTAFEDVADDRLRLIFTCCHPALSNEARVALTLRLVCGLSSAEVASAYVVKEATMQARITRAKKKVAEAGIPYRVPTQAELPSRLPAVLDTINLVLTAGHTAFTGASLMRADLSARAVQLARMLHDLLPDEPETASLLALTLLTLARSPARTDADGLLVPLEQQDRSLWDWDAIAAGGALLRDALSRGASGKYTVMASLAAVHSEARTAEATDWQQAVQLYDLLMRVWPTPVVALNRAIAVGFRDGPAAGLQALEPLGAEPSLATYHYLPAAVADFRRRSGDRDGAACAYREAIMLTANPVEAAYLRRRLDEVHPDGVGDDR